MGLEEDLLLVGSASLADGDLLAGPRADPWGMQLGAAFHPCLSLVLRASRSPASV